MSNSSLIDVEGLTHIYSHGSGRVALQEISFTVQQGEIFALLGPNGGGKTTAFHVLTTLLLPSGGTARIFGYDVRQDTLRVRSRMGIVFQTQSLDGKLTVLENLTHHGHLYGLMGNSLRERIETFLLQLGLTERRQDRVETLSGGLKRRVELAKGLLHEPELLLLDEPTASLDFGARKNFWRYLMRIREQKKISILFTTHLLEEAEYCTRVGFLDGGRLVAMGTPQSLKDKIGEKIIVLETGNSERLQQQIEQNFGVSSTVLGSTLRIERPRGRELMAELLNAFGEDIRSATLGKPTLEDVFIHVTGHRFGFTSIEGDRK